MIQYRLRASIILIFSLLVFYPIQAHSSEGKTEILKIRENIVIEKGESVARVYSLMGSVTVNGRVNETVVSFMGDVTVGPNGVIKGDAISIGGHVIRKKGSSIKGKEISLGLPLKNVEKFFFLAVPMMASMAAIAIGTATLLGSFGFVALIICVLVLFEKQVSRAQKTMVQSPLQSSLLGILGFVCIIPIIVFLTLTIIGIPLAFLGTAVAVAALVLGVVSVGHWVGLEITKHIGWKLKTLWSGLLGTLVLFLLGLLPFFGLLIQLCVLFLGLGAVIQTRFRA